MTTTPVLIPIPNLGAGTDPPNPAADLVAVSQSGVARKLTINELLDGASPTSLTVANLTVTNSANFLNGITIGSSTFTGTPIIINGSSAATRQIRWYTAGSLRWAAGLTPNTASDWGLNRYDDSGILIDVPVSISRSPVANASLTTVTGNIRQNAAYDIAGSADVQSRFLISSAVTGTNTVAGSTGLSSLRIAQSYNGATPNGSYVTGLINMTTGAAWDGGLTGWKSFLSTGAAAALSSQSFGLFGAEFTVNANHNMGGVASGFGSTQFGVGTLFGANPRALNIAGTFLAGVSGQEVGAKMLVAASSANFVVQQLVLEDGHNGHGLMRDGMLILGAQANAVTGTREGIEIGGRDYHWPIDPNGYLIASHIPSSWATKPSAAAGGLDFNDVAFSGTGTWGSGFAFRGRGISLLPTSGNGGALRAGFAALASTSTGADLSVNQDQMTGTPAINAAGSNWQTGMVAGDVYGNLVSITATAGAVTAIAVINRGFVPTGTGATTGVAFTCKNAVNGFYGSGLTLNLTWTPQTSLSIQSGGSATAIGGKVAIASTAIDALTVQGGGTFGPDDFRQVEINPDGAGIAPTDSPHVMQIRRVGSDNTVPVLSNKWVSKTSWVLTATGPGSTIPQFNTYVSTSAGAGTDPGETWGFLSSIASAAGGNDTYNMVGGYIQAVRTANPAVGIGAVIEGLVVEARDQTNTASSLSGRMRTLELDMLANGDDDYAGVGREIIPIILGRNNLGGAAPTFTSVIGIYAGQTDVAVKRGVTWAAGINYTQSLWDTRDAVQGASANAIWLKAGHTIALDGDSTGAATPATVKLSAVVNTLTVTAPTSSFTGSVVVAGYVDYSVGNALTAVGTTRANALQLAKQVNRVTTAAASTGVVLPVGVVGMRITVFNAGANPIKVYASASETVDGTAGSTGVTLTNALRCDYFFVAANTWVSAQLGAVSA